jgi:hypothetical protein
MPHWPAPRGIARKNRRDMCMIPSVVRRRNREKKCENRVDTRENGQARSSMSLWLQPATHTHSIVLSGNFRYCSFSPVKVSQKCSQLIHTRVAPFLASGLETRNPLQNRQEKNEILFFGDEKIFLTKKWKDASPRENKKLIAQ